MPINHLHELALTEKDHSTLQFLMWFLQEQVEEESIVSDIFDGPSLACDNAAGSLRLDDEAERHVAMSGAAVGKQPG